MTLKVRKTDKRFTGSNHFDYVVDIKADTERIMGMIMKSAIRYKEFHDVRRWCIDTWGMSCERSHYLHMSTALPEDVNARWCWHSEFDETKIYLKSSKEANWFKLKWL
jgi:hypothetical protein